MAQGAFTSPSYLRGAGPVDEPTTEPARLPFAGGADADVQAGQIAGLLVAGAVVVLILYNAIGFKATTTVSAQVGK